MATTIQTAFTATDEALRILAEAEPDATAELQSAMDFTAESRSPKPEVELAALAYRMAELLILFHGDAAEQIAAEVARHAVRFAQEP